MNGDRTMEEVPYVDRGFPYTVAGSFMGFFDGVTYPPVSYAHAGTMHPQDNLYWTMNTNAYKFGYSCPDNASYYSSYDVNDHLSRMCNVGRMTWEYHPTENTEEPETTVALSIQNGDTDEHSEAEERIQDRQNADGHSPQVSWEDSSMTYEELLELSEAVGSGCRGLSQELIEMLPKRKYKLGSIFSRKRSRERCVICQLKYKIGERQTNLPCNHFYHSDCISKWLSINKVCPVCNREVFGGESSTH